MKFIFTLLGLFFMFSAFSQVQLDSIIIISEEYDEESTQYNYSYDQGLLKQYQIEFENELFVTSELEYDSEGRMVRVVGVSDGEVETIFDITYNEAGQFDSVFYEIFGIQNNIGVYEYTDDKLSKITALQEVDGSAFEVFRYEYEYIDNREIVKTFSAGFGGLLTTITSWFNADNKIVKWEEQASMIPTLTDSMVYNNGCLENVLRRNTTTGEFIEINTYSCDETLDYSMILNPVEYLTFEDPYFSDPYLNIIWPILYSTKVESSVGQFDFEESTSEWFYSVVSSLDERVVATPFSVYPNPTKDLIRMNLDATLVEYTIYDMNGGIVNQSSMPDDQMISVENLANGSYTIVAKTKDESHYFAQFVKQ